MDILGTKFFCIILQRFFNNALLCKKEFLNYEIEIVSLIIIDKWLNINVLKNISYYIAKLLSTVCKCTFKGMGMKFIAKKGWQKENVLICLFLSL